MSLPTNLQKQYIETPYIGNLDYIYATIHWDEMQEVSVTGSVYDVVPLHTTYNSKRHVLILALVVTLLSSTADENTENSCGVYRRIGYLELDVAWEDDENRKYKRPGIDILLDAMAKDSTKQSIVIM